MSSMRAMPNLHSLIFSTSLRRCGAAEMRFWAAVASLATCPHHPEILSRGADVSLSSSECSVLGCVDAGAHTWLFCSYGPLSVKHAAFLLHPLSVVQFSRVLRNSSSPEALTVHPCSHSLPADVSTHTDILELHPLRTTQLSTCTLSYTTYAFGTNRTYKLLRSTSSRLKRRSTRAHSLGSLNAHRRYSAPHGST